KSFESRASSSERATMQLRTSPGGSMLNSLRRRPLDPPSSLTVTTPHNSRMVGWPEVAAAGDMTYRFSPFSSVERPVPPPIATTRSSGPALPVSDELVRNWGSIPPQLELQRSEVGLQRGKVILT